MRCEKTVEAGAYVLGALAPAERAGYERHTAGCVECRDEVADLAVLPGLLGRLDAGTAVALADPPVQAPPQILTSTLNAARTERLRDRRRHRWQLAGAGVAAACLAVLLGLGVNTVVRGESPPSSTAPVLAQMTPVNGDVPVVAMVGYTAGHGGTDVQLLCHYETPPPSGVVWTISLVAYPRGGGKSIPIMSWPMGPGGDDTATDLFPGHIGLSPQDIDLFEIVKSDGTPLLAYRPS